MVTNINNEIAYSRLFKPLATAVGLSQGHTEASIAAGILKLRMGWAFSLQAPTSAVVSAIPVADAKWWWGCGAHVIGRGRWIINGTLRGLVEINFQGPVAARALGVRVAVRSVLVSVPDARGFAKQLRPTS